MSATDVEGYFRETQRFRQLWLWFFLIVTAAFLIYGLIQQLYLGVALGNNPVSDFALILLSLVFGVGMPLFFYSIRLITEVRSDGVYVKFFPFHRKFHKVDFSDIEHFEIRYYKALKEYGGWGIRYGLNGKAYNVSGNKGVMLHLQTGKRLLIGTRKPEEFYDALKNAAGDAGKAT